jgi:hypothetical protein
MGAGKKLQIHTAKEVVCGSGFAIATKDLTALEPELILNDDATQGVRVGSKNVILESSRESVLIKTDSGSLVNYTINVVITRDPVTDAERAAVTTFAAKGKARKDEQLAKEVKTKQDIATANFALGKDSTTAGVQTGLAALGQIAPVLKVLREAGLAQ